MIDPSAYAELQKRTETAYRRFAEEAVAAFEELRKIDPELAQFAIHAYGRPEVMAISLAAAKHYCVDRVANLVANNRRNWVQACRIAACLALFSLHEIAPKPLIASPINPNSTAKSTPGNPWCLRR